MSLFVENILREVSLKETDFKNQKDIEIAAKIWDLFHNKNNNTPLSQLDICKAVGFQTYDMRTTMVLRAMVISQELIVDRSAKPMKLYMNPQYKAGVTAPIAVQAKPPKEKKPTSNKAKMELAEKIKSDMYYFKPGNYYMKEDPEIQVNGDRISIGKQFRDLGTWVSDYDNSYDKEDGWDEDDDNKIWKDAKKYVTIWKDWVKSKDWAKNVKEVSFDTSEKSWCEFYVTLK